MAYELRRHLYRTWYAQLLRLHSRTHHEQFGEGMEQTFNDLLRERADEGRGLLGCVMWVFVETFVGIIRENKKIMIMPFKNIARVALITAAILMIPLLLMVFQVYIPDSGSTAQGGVNWTVSDFLVMGTLLFVTGMVLDFIVRRAGAYRAVAAIGVIVLFLWIWAELAVGIFTNWGS